MRGCTEFSQMEIECMHLRQNRIGLLGGTFNPIHNGHLSMAYIALYEFMLSKVVFLPAGNPPHKTDEYIAPGDARLDLIKLAIEDEQRFDIDTLELDRDGRTYTVDTLEILTRMNKTAEFYFIIGADTLFELETWKNYKRVFCLTHFICILRPGHDDDNVRQYADMLNNKYGNKIHLANEKGPDISSSLIRRLAVNHMLTDCLVPGKVARYISRNHVYCKEE